MFQNLNKLQLWACLKIKYISRLTSKYFFKHKRCNSNISGLNFGFKNTKKQNKNECNEFCKYFMHDNANLISSMHNIQYYFVCALKITFWQNKINYFRKLFMIFIKKISKCVSKICYIFTKWILYSHVSLIFLKFCFKISLNEYNFI